MSKPLSQLDFNCCCRICLHESDFKLAMHDLFSENVNVKNPVFLKIINCAPVQVVKNDGLPQQVCVKCMKKLDETCEFQKLIVNSDQKLRDFLKHNGNIRETSEVYENTSESKKTHLQNLQECTNEVSDADDASYIESQPKIYPCVICKKLYKTADSLRTHKQIHTNKSLKCQNCGKTFTYRRLLMQHMSVHSKEKPFHCSVCNKSFKKKTQLKIHSRRHVNERPFQCSYCDKKFFQVSHRNQHLRLHTNERPFRCDICGKTYRNQAGYVAHKMQKHSNAKPFQCEICAKEFSLKTSLKNHLNLHGEKSSICEHCGQTFASVSSLKNHVKVHSGENVRVCKCCGKKFSKTLHFEDHIRTHEDSKNFMCSTCGKCFKQSAGLTVHMKTHAAERLYRCDLCDKSFTTKQTLEVHYRRHTGAKPYKCDDCGKCFRQGATLKNHSKLHKENYQFSKEEATNIESLEFQAKTIDTVNNFKPLVS